MTAAAKGLLTEAFLQGRGLAGEGAPPLSASLTGQPGLEDALQAAATRGRDRWPRLAVSPEDFAGHLGRVLPAEASDDFAAVIARLVHEDLYLACACTIGNHDAQCAFDEEVLCKVPLYLSQLRLTEAQGQEVRDALRARLLFGDDERGPQLASFQGQGSLAAFVRVAAVRAGISLMRKRDEQLGHTPPEKALNNALARAGDSDPELAYLRQRYRAEFQQATLDAIKSLDEEQRGVLQLYYVNGVNTRQIAKLFKVNPTTASRWVADGRDQIAREARRLLRERLRVTDTELLSIYRVLQSQLDLSLKRVL